MSRSPGSRDSIRRRRRAPRPARSAPLLAIALGALLACSEPPSATRIVLVTLDTTRADYLGCYGDDEAHTPALDAIAEAGVRFDQAIAPAPITLVSHSTLFTGLDPPRHGVRHNGIFRLDPALPTVAARLRASGFDTAAFVGAAVLDRQYGLDTGFDVPAGTTSENANTRAHQAVLALHTDPKKTQSLRSHDG